jgi:hypothetical protein
MASSSSGGGKDASLAKGAMYERAGHRTPPRRLLLRDHNYIDRHAQRWKRIAQQHHLAQLALHTLLDDEEIEVAILPRIPPRS